VPISCGKTWQTPPKKGTHSHSRPRRAPISGGSLVMGLRLIHRRVIVPTRGSCQAATHKARQLSIRTAVTGGAEAFT
jgi:hypothetical protein